jgi:RNA polymerase sigma-70 factor (ECF subfamily)
VRSGGLGSRGRDPDPVTGDWDLAEECAQDAFARALERWPRDGIPRVPVRGSPPPRGTARSTACAATQSGATKLREAAMLSPPTPDPSVDESGVTDDRLRLIFTCCHPALSVEAQVALTLRTLAGLTTGEIARAFLVPSPRWRSDSCGRSARSAMPASRTACRPRTCCPSARTRCSSVLYLLFNEGYSASRGRICSGRRVGEAIRLARTLAELMPDEPEALGSWR